MAKDGQDERFEPLPIILPSRGICWNIALVRLPSGWNNRRAGLGAPKCRRGSGQRRMVPADREFHLGQPLAPPHRIEGACRSTTPSRKSAQREARRHASAGAMPFAGARCTGSLSGCLEINMIIEVKLPSTSAPTTPPQ